MRATLIAMLALAACGQTSAPASAPPAAVPAATQVSAVVPNNCPASATTQWDGGGAKFDIAATATGADCANATLDILIRDAQGGIAHSGSYSASAMQNFASPESVADMSRMLREWITPAGASRDSTGDLAPWAEGAPAPSNDNMPFTPAAGMTRDVYEALRTADVPMYCYQQSNTNGACFAMHDGVLRLLGLQAYTG